MEIKGIICDFGGVIGSDADVILLVIDSSKNDYFDSDLIDKIKSLKIPILIVLNKIDLIDNTILDQIVEKFSSIFKSEFIFPISITNTFNLDNLLDKIIELSPEGNPYFSKDQITDKSERFFVNEIMVSWYFSIPNQIGNLTNLSKPDLVFLQLFWKN